jgi:hypothetical protein
MANRLLTPQEVTDEILRPMLAAFKADIPAIEADARKAFARGESVYREIVMGIAVELRPKDLGIQNNAV